jgi:uncharacterized NAD-dependent epimerase/dehydratase family protein
MMIPQTSKLALLMHGYVSSRHGKMGAGILRYSDYDIVAVIDSQETGKSLAAVTGIDRDVPIVDTVAAARALGADTLVIAVATSGGVLPDGYREEIVSGLKSGMHLVNGLHGTYADDSDFAVARQPGAVIWDVRQEPPGLGSGRGRALGLTCRRVLTVGTDMAIGKMTASLELHFSAQKHGLRSAFLATGQIGIVISGDGVALDAVRVDFATGAVEALCLRHADVDVQWVEGQGSILHPGSTAWLGLMRGSQPTDLILVHRANQKHLDQLDAFPIPPIRDVIAAYEMVASLNPGFSAPKVRAIALNCGQLPNDAAAKQACADLAAETGLVVDDVVRFGADRLLAALELRS